VCAAANGDFVVAFLDDYPPAQTGAGQDGSGSAPCLRRFDADSTPGFELLANSYTTGDQLDIAAACAPGGDFLVTWADRPNDDGGRTAFDGRAFDSNSSPKGNPFLIGGDQFAGGNESTAVCRRGQGGFLTVFRKLDGTLGAQRYDVNGAAAGTELVVVAGAGSGVGQPACCGGDFGFVIAWADYIALDIGVQRFSATAEPLGARFVVNTYTTALQESPEVACNDDGRFVVVWDSGFAEPQDGDLWGVFGRAFAWDGAPVGSEFQANTYTSGSQQHAQATMDAAGRFVVVWDGPQATNHYRAIFGQAFAAGATRIGSEFRIDGSGQHSQSSNSEYPSAATTSATGFVVVWENDEDEGSGDGIFGRLFDFPSSGVAACGDPVDRAALRLGGLPRASSLTASDALFILRTAVGSETCALCVCDVDASDMVTATDALVTLKAAVGQSVSLSCPAC
jgi:hypothetical protein